MATYDFRVLLETVDGGKTSYYSSSFVDTSTDLVLSASQVWGRITGSISCSYQNALNFSQSTAPTTSDINTSYVFKDNNLLSASLSGSLDKGLIEFKSLDIEYDRLLRYKFFGDKVCTTLGLPNNQWVYVDQMRLPADDESNYFEGNINAKSIYISDNLSFANNARVTTDIPFQVDTGSDQHIKFVDYRGIPKAALSMGYDKDDDMYEIDGGGNTTDNGFRITNANVDEFNVLSSSLYQHTTNTFIKVAGGMEIAGPQPTIEIQSDVDNKRKLELFIVSDLIKILSTDDMVFGTSGFVNAIYIDKSEDRVGINTNSPEATLHVAGDLKVDGGMQVIGAITSSIVSSSILYSSGSNIFGDESSDRHTFNGDIDATGTNSTVSASNFYLTSSAGVVVHMGMSGDSNIGKWEWHRNGTRKQLIYLEGRDNQIVPQDSLVFKHGIASDGNDHINFHTEQDDQTVYFHGDVSSSGHFYGQTYYYTHHNFTYSSTNEQAVPLNSLSNGAVGGYQRRWIAPFDGTLHKVLIHTENAAGSTVSKLYVNGSAASTSDTVSISATTTATFTFSSGNTYSSGNMLAVTFDPTDAPGDTQVTCIWSYDTST